MNYWIAPNYRSSEVMCAFTFTGGANFIGVHQTTRANTIGMPFYRQSTGEHNLPKGLTSGRKKGEPRARSAHLPKRGTIYVPMQASTSSPMYMLTLHVLCIGLFSFLILKT
ncbi:hypothetical protein AMTR_s00174p00020300 [Amborella trichopoda]|uniref:Uncharacterized protein n=1 Tax=Amborella trichopoda TaxID=13333 RepID=U5CWF1_AMBTC|nr:hypothetical protein AMTR_s00174p00020300 [Amborella trichopoda]